MKIQISNDGNYTNCTLVHNWKNRKFSVWLLPDEKIDAFIALCKEQFFWKPSKKTIEKPKEDGGDNELEEVSWKYEKQYGKKVPNNKRKDIKWIQSKLD